jgi:integrase
VPLVGGVDASKNQIDFNAGTILLHRTKAGKPQTVTINAPARQVLSGLKRDDSCPWVLPGKRKSEKDQWKPLAKDAMEAAWQKLRAAAGLDDVRMHDSVTFIRQSDHPGITGGGPWNVAGFCKASAASGTGA